MAAIYGAKDEIWISTPYFVPGEAILNAIIAASMRGVDVVLIVPKQSDFKVACLAGAYNYFELLESGVTIRHFKGGLLHTKSITVDGRLSIFGTVNLDMRSFWLNSEVTLLVYDEAFTKELRQLQQRYWDQSEAIILERWKERSRWRRALESARPAIGTRAVAGGRSRGCPATPKKDAPRGWATGRPAGPAFSFREERGLKGLRNPPRRGF